MMFVITLSDFPRSSILRFNVDRGLTASDITDTRFKRRLGNKQSELLLPTRFIRAKAISFGIPSNLIARVPINFVFAANAECESVLGQHFQPNNKRFTQVLLRNESQNPL